MNLSGNMLTDDALSAIPDDSAITVILLNQNKFTAKGARFVAQRKNMIEIDLGANKVADDGAECFVSNDKLQRLNLMRSGITGKGFSKLCTSKSIKYLCLYDNKIGFKKEDRVPENHSFVDLNLSCNQFTSQCEEVLKALASIPTLQSLNLASNQIDAAGRNILHKYHSPALKRIDLLDNPTQSAGKEAAPEKSKKRHRTK